MTPLSGNISLKHQIRTQARRLRRKLSDKQLRSEKIATTLRGLPEYIDARAILFYVDAGSEVPTRPLIDEALREGRPVVVPYCHGDELKLFRLESMSELAPAAFDIEEPRTQLRDIPARSVAPSQIDLVIVPGVAFDPQGGRIGQGKGYYDRFLKTLQDNTKIISLAYQCQIFSSIPMTPHDIPVHIVVTEDNVYRPIGPMINDH